MNPPRDRVTDDDSRVHIDGVSQSHVSMLKLVAAESAQLEVSKTLERMGLDPTKPFEAQKDMMFLRSRREWSEKGMWHAVTVFITLSVAGVGGWLWLGFKGAVK